MHLKDFETARVNFEAMVTLHYQPAPAHYNLGLLAAARGDLAEARRRYELSLTADPGFKPAREALAKLK
jgi:Tfp pilus assembly protein PilF